MPFITKTPKPPYYSVTFTSEQSDDLTGYDDIAEQLEKLAEVQHGFFRIRGPFSTKFSEFFGFFWHEVGTMNVRGKRSGITCFSRT